MSNLIAITPVKHPLSVIPAETVYSLLKNISIMNKCIKQPGMLPIPKSSFYMMKHHFIDYLIYMIETGTAYTGELHYQIDGVEKQQIHGKTHPQYLLSMSFFCPGPEVYQFHHIMDTRNKLKMTVKYNVENIEETSVYTAPEMPVPNVTTEELLDMWKDFNDTMEKYSWCILQLTNSCEVFFQRLAPRYKNTIANKNGIIYREHNMPKHPVCHIFKVDGDWNWATQSIMCATTLDYKISQG